MQWLGALCASEPALRGGILAGLFLAGAAGSVMHCAPMCGPFVLGQVADRMARLPAALICERRRLSAGLLLPYHAGRLLTYAGLGALAAASAAVLSRAPWMRGLSGTLLALAGVIFLAHALHRLAPGRLPFAPVLERAPPGIGRALARGVARVPRGTAAGEFAMGLLLGFLPCGFLYGALIAAAATGRPAMGAAAMLCFGLGTVPSLAVVGIAGQAAGRRWQRGVALAGPALMTVNAVALLLLAWRQMA
ncbi:MAG: sulfite exporter TauE/SafE family protein [Proteobacteria bacterium]|nr:sulfite exporter TauE/SafE family protein [Pseudomonadota bacterium]